MLLRSRRVERSPPIHNGLKRRDVVEIHVFAGYLEVQVIAVTEHFAFAGVRQDDEFMRLVAADGAALRHHGDGSKSQAGKGAQVSDEHLVIGMGRAGMVDVERIGVLHEELTPAHQSEAGAHLIAEFPLDVIEIKRQASVRFDVSAENPSDHFLIGWAIKQLPLVPVGDSKHFRTVGIIAAALAPEVRQLQRGHQ